MRIYSAGLAMGAGVFFLGASVAVSAGNPMGSEKEQAEQQMQMGEQPGHMGEGAQQRKSQAFSPSLFNADTLDGAIVVDDQRQPVGVVRHVVVGKGEGAMSYALVDPMTETEEGEKKDPAKTKLTVVPLAALRGFQVQVTQGVQVEPLGEEARRTMEERQGEPVDESTVISTADALVLASDMTSKDFKEAPAYTPNEISDADFAGKVHSYYIDRSVDYGRKLEPFAKKARPRAEVKKGAFVADQLRGFQVQNEQGMRLGEMQHVVIDSHEGRAVFALLSIAGTPQTAAVPWQSLDLRSKDKLARIDANREALRAIAFDGDLARLEDREFAARIHDTVATDPYWQVYGYPPNPGAAWLPQSTYNNQFDAARATDIRGQVTNVSTFRPQPGANEGLQLTIRTEDGQEVVIHGGPQDWSDQQDLPLEIGNEVTVTGSPATINGQQVILARRIESGGQVLEIRDAEGTPLW